MPGHSMERLAEPLRLRRKCHLLAADLTDSHAISRVGAKIASRKREDVLVLSSRTYERSQESTVFAGQIAANVIAPYASVRQMPRCRKPKAESL